MVSKDFNKILKLNGLALLLGLSLGGCQNAEDKANERLKQGVELFKQGDYQKAQLELKSAIQADGSVADSYYYMALLNEKDKQFKAMKENLAQALKLEPNNHDARLKYGRVLLMFNEADQALAQATEILKQKNDDFEALTLKAAALIKQKNIPEAQMIVEGILQKNPRYSPASALRILIAMEASDYDQATSLVDAAIALDSENLELHLLKIQIDSNKKDIPAIIKDYNVLIKLQPEVNGLKVALAKIYILANRNNDADALLAEMAAAHPEQIEPKLYYLEFLNSVDKPKAAGLLQTYITQGKTNPNLLFGLSQWLISTGQLEAAQQLLENENVKEQSPEIEAKMRLSLAELRFNKKEYAEASQLVDEMLITNSTNQQAKILKAKILVAQQQYEPAIDLFNKVLWESPELDSVVTLLGEIELLRHEPDKADKKFREALEINPANLNALQPVIRRAFAQGDNRYVDELITKALQFKPDDLNLAEQLARIKIAEKDWEGAKLAITALEKNPQAHAIELFLRAKLLQAQGDCPAAIEGYKAVLVKFPAQADALSALSECYEKLQQRPQMIAFLDEYIRGQPQQISAYLLKSHLLRLNKNDREELATLQQALSFNKQNSTIYGLLAEHYAAKNDFKNAFAQYQLGLENLPENAELQIEMAQMYEKINDFNKAIAIYEQVIAKNPELEVAINNLASILIDHFEDAKSMEKAKALVANFKSTEQPYFLDTYGWVEAKTGDVNKAISVLEKVNTMAADVPIFKYHLGIAYQKQGNQAGAASQLQEALSLNKQGKPFAESKLAEQMLQKMKLAQ